MPLADLVAAARERLDCKPVRYSIVSAVAVVVTQVVLITTNGALGWPAVVANLAAVSAGCVPSYTLNRYWVWGKRGPNHLWREVVPFWVLALLGLAVSTLLVWLADRWWDSTVLVSAANLTAFGALWVAKYLLLDSLLFRIVAEEGPGRASVAPTDAGARLG
ncbi:MAG: GtrA family protein [Acidimicrobiales bacterium]